MMPNREIVIKGLESLSKSMHENECYACSHEFIETAEEFGTNIIADAIEMLKEQQEQIDRLIEENASNAEMAEGVKELLKEQEAVVRCKDCIHWDKGHTEECDNIDSVSFHNGVCKPDWFCTDGERRCEE